MDSTKIMNMFQIDAGFASFDKKKKNISASQLNVNPQNITFNWRTLKSVINTNKKRLPVKMTEKKRRTQFDVLQFMKYYEWEYSSFITKLMWK